MSCGQIVLQIQDLRVTLAPHGSDQRPLVDGVGLTVNKGNITGLIGESGCGKSLTCLAVMDLLPKAMQRQDGNIMLAGAPIEETPLSKWRCFRGRRAAMILQNPMSCFDPVFTIGRHIKETLKAHGLNGTQIDQTVFSTLLELGFERPGEILAAYPFQLSGGMLQRIMISLALLLEAELLIADEPTTDLDVVVQSHILELIDRLCRKKNVGVLLVTHDLSVIARLSDEVVVMQNGRIVEAASVVDIFSKPKENYTKALLSAHFSLYGSGMLSQVSK